MKKVLYIFVFLVLLACETDNRVFIKHYMSYRKNPLESIDTAYLFITQKNNSRIYTFSVNNLPNDTLAYSPQCVFYPKSNVLMEDNIPCIFREEKVFIIDKDTFLVKKYYYDRENSVDEEHLRGIDYRFWFCGTYFLRK